MNCRSATTTSPFRPTGLQLAEPGDGGADLAYEVRVAYLDRQQAGAPQLEETPYPLVDDLERFYQHLEQTLQRTGFIRPSHPGQVMSRLRRLFTARARKGRS